MKSIKFVICCCVMIVFATTAFAQDSEAEDLFKFEAGYPTPDASQALYDEMDYQRAVQAYIWATPMLNSMGWRAGQGAGQAVLADSSVRSGNAIHDQYRPEEKHALEHA